MAVDNKNFAKKNKPTCKCEYCGCFPCKCGADNKDICTCKTCKELGKDFKKSSSKKTSLKEQTLDNTFDCVIIGGGPAGLTAAVYALRAGLSTLLIEKFSVGGQAALTSDIENYPGFKKIGGFELGETMLEQATALGLKIIYGEVLQLNLKDPIKKVISSEGTFFARGIILSMGASARKLGLNNETELIGRGVSYCATCDGAFYKNKTCVVIGGGNSALEDALYLSKICKTVYIIHRRDTFKADEILTKELKENCINKKECVKIVYNSFVTEILADDLVTGVKIKNVHTGKEQIINTDGVFIAIGRNPDTELVEGQIEIDKNGYIITNEARETNIKGVYAAGDVIVKEVRQIITACSDGAIAATHLNRYLKSLK